MMQGISRLLIGVVGTCANIAWLWSFAPPL